MTFKFKIITQFNTVCVISTSNILLLQSFLLIPIRLTPFIMGYHSLSAKNSFLILSLKVIEHFFYVITRKKKSFTKNRLIRLSFIVLNLIQILRLEKILLFMMLGFFSFQCNGVGYQFIN